MYSDAQSGRQSQGGGVGSYLNPTAGLATNWERLSLLTWKGCWAGSTEHLIAPLLTFIFIKYMENMITCWYYIHLFLRLYSYSRCASNRLCWNDKQQNNLQPICRSIESVPVVVRCTRLSGFSWGVGVEGWGVWIWNHGKWYPWGRRSTIEMVTGPEPVTFSWR